MVAAGAPAPPKVVASSFLIADADTGEVLAAKDAHGRYLPASTLKTLTAATMIPKLDPNATVKPTPFTTKVVPTTIGLDPKKTYKVKDLFRIMLMISANDAAKAIAQAAGGYQKAVAMLNAEAKRLGAQDTLAGSPNGLDDDLGLSVRTQHSSAYDLALIFRQGLRLPDFVDYITTLKCKFPYWGTQITHDKMLLGPYKYPGMIGGKTGFTTAAMQNFVGAARRNGHTIIISEMHSSNQFWADAAKLLNWGFAADGKVTPVGRLTDPPQTSKADSAPAPASASSPKAVNASRPGSGNSVPTPLLIIGGLAVVAAGLLAGFLIVAARRAR